MTEPEHYTPAFAVGAPVEHRLNPKRRGIVMRKLETGEYLVLWLTPACKERRAQWGHTLKPIECPVIALALLERMP